MKIKQFFTSLVVVFVIVSANAQSAIPESFTKATITLANGSEVSGYIKDNMKKSAAIVFIDEAGQNKKTYDAADINAVKIAEASYICIGGDFFKTMTTGKLTLLQKMSNAAGKVSYNGSDAVISTGTVGKIGDYLLYKDNKLKVLNKKTMETFANTDLAGCAPAIEKATAANGDILKMQEAIIIYNEYAKKVSMK